MGTTPALWSTLVDLGWTGLLVPDEHGGTGTGLLETCVVLEQRGGSRCPGRSSPPPWRPHWPPGRWARPSCWPTWPRAHGGGRSLRGAGARRAGGHRAHPGPAQGEPLGPQRRETVRDGRAHGGLGHRRGAERGGRALLPARVAGGRARPVAGPDAQIGAAGVRGDAGHAAGATGQPARPVAADRGRHGRRPGSRDGGRRRPGAERSDRLHVGADRLRQAGRDVPDRAPPAGRDVPAGGDGAGRVPVRRVGIGHRVARAGPVRRHGVELRRRGGRAGHGRRHPAPRRGRLRRGPTTPTSSSSG